MNPTPYLTVPTSTSHEIVVERSRFIGHCLEVATEIEAKAYVAKIREDHSQANHNCFAYRIGNDEHPLEYYNDHGEPGGTAGKPILGAIQRLNLTNTVVVVTRYFGGKKLGVRGLIEAYGQTATGVLEKAGTVTRIPKFTAKLVYPYSEHSLVLHRMQQVEAEVVETVYTDVVRLRIMIAQTKQEDFEKLMEELAGYKVIVGITD